MFTNEAPVALEERRMKNFVAGENGINGNAIIQRLTIEYGSFEKYRRTWV
jgi:hypothetical protein